ncbi:MAG TPA: phosphoglucosamine mutase [Candidatus Aphodousia faecigallinarum]|uniref:Phosphoglucosamine mutase n=1 Tax=Candidatus Aphodousia faecigallinarum TaxID=2840677 RepID=A0A9D1IJD1_9BURK|nr:phosphoglucosamine mutase [Candidatus Aphodousia faecigallinarum]
MTRKYFGTDGVRGRVGEAPITPDFVMKLGQAAGRVLRRHLDGHRHVRVVIGKDTRVSGYMLEAALQAGFSSAGVDVVLCGPIPTPAIAYLTRAQRADAGVVISASHNPYNDNGIKFFSESGTKLPDEVELEIEEELDKGFSCVESRELGKAWRLEDASGRYIEFCKSTIDSNVNLKGLRILVDCANGAAYHVAPAVYHELGADVFTVGDTPDGFNINDGVGATHTEQLSKKVFERGCDVGIALDGDADRLIMADANGHVYNGDELLYVMVRDRMLREKVNGVVGTLMTNYALEKRFAELGVEFVRAKVGDRYVLEQLKAREGWIFGGETSGHLLVLDCQTTGDGIVSSLQVLAAMRRQGKTLAQLTQDLKLLPQVLINKRIEKGFDWKSHEPMQKALSEAQAKLEGRGRVLIRPSGTEPLLRVMVEADDKTLAQTLAQRIADTL